MWLLSQRLWPCPQQTSRARAVRSLAPPEPPLPFSTPLLVGPTTPRASLCLSQPPLAPPSCTTDSASWLLAVRTGTAVSPQLLFSSGPTFSAWLFSPPLPDPPTRRSVLALLSSCPPQRLFPWRGQN